MGIYDLRLSPSQFWKLTLRQYFALLQRRNADWKAQDRRAGTVAATVANCLSKKKEGSWQPQDFMPDWGDRKPGQTPEEMMAVMMMAAPQGKGKKKRA